MKTTFCLKCKRSHKRATYCPSPISKKYKIGKYSAYWSDYYSKNKLRNALAMRDKLNRSQKTKEWQIYEWSSKKGKWISVRK